MNTPCNRPPAGWWCSREAGHEGPCAARPGSRPEAVNTPEQAREITERFLIGAKRQWMDEADRVLREIALLPWSQRWRAKYMAERCLGVGPYWDLGFGKHRWLKMMWRRWLWPWRW